jgi:uncharacterized protein YukE
MPRRFQFSLRALFALMAIAAVCAAVMHYNRENEIARVLSHLRAIQRMQAKIDPVQQSWQGKQLVDGLRSDRERWEKRLKQLTWQQLQCDR